MVKNFLKLKENKYVNISMIVVAMIISGLILMFGGRDDKKNVKIEKVEQQRGKESLEWKMKKNEVQIPDKKAELEEAYNKNKDTVGWINIPGTLVDWPVMKGKDNNYYLRRNEKKEYAFEGCIFGDDDSVFFPIDKLSNNIVIHGHNLDDNPEGKRFAQLIKFQDMEFAKRTPYIYLTTQDASLIYEIYAVFFTDIKFGYISVGLDEKMQKAMIDSAKQRSEYIYEDVEVTGKDKIITLSTCTYRYGAYGSVGQGNTRFAIQGKLINDVSNLKTQANLKKNPDPKKPNLK